MDINKIIEVRKALIPHVFLLRKLPAEELPDLKRQECNLLRLFSDQLNRDDLKKVSQLDTVRQAFGVWVALQSTGRINPKCLATAINELHSGQHLPLLVRAQNAGLLISIPTLGALPPTSPDEQVAGFNQSVNLKADTLSLISENRMAVISTFPASLPTHEVVSSVAPPTFVYPATSVRVPFSSTLKSLCLAQQISRLDATSQNIVSNHQPSDPKFVSQWLTGVLTNESSEPNCSIQPICKKVRDEVVVDNTESDEYTEPDEYTESDEYTEFDEYIKSYYFNEELKSNFNKNNSNKITSNHWFFARKPFRRSPMWMSARVVLQLLLVNAPNEPFANQQLLYKLIVLRFLCTFLDESIVEQIDTDTAMQMNAKIARRLHKVESLFRESFNKDSAHYSDLVWLVRQSQINVAEAVERTRALLGKRWDAVIQREREDSQLPLLPSHLQFLADSKYNVKQINSYIDSLNKMSIETSYLNQTEYQPDSNESGISEKFFYETEALNLKDLRLKDCPHVRVTFENYLTQSLFFYFYNFYYVFEDHKDVFESDPQFFSRMLLTLLKLICALDEKATEKHTLLSEHKLGIPPEIIQSLLLPLKSDMELAAQLEEHLLRREAASLPSLIEENELSRDSYSVRHAQRSAEMQDIKRRILETENRKRKRRGKCGNQQRVLPAEEHWRDAVVFELSAPEEIVHLRECLYLFTTRIFGFLRSPNNRKQRVIDYYSYILQWSDIRYSSSYRFENPIEILINTKAGDLFLMAEDSARVGQLHPNNDIDVPQINDCTPIEPESLEYWIGCDHLKEFRGTTCSSQKYYRLSCPEEEITPLFSPTRDYRYFARLFQKSASECNTFERVVRGNCNIILKGKSCSWNINAHNLNVFVERCLVRHETNYSVSKYCRLYIGRKPLWSLSIYSDLEWAIDDTTHTQNEELSTLNQCAADLFPTEFLESATFCTGHRLQLRNLYRALSQRTLALNSRDVHILILQSLWKAGPPLASQEKTLKKYEVHTSVVEDRIWIRDAHADLLCPHFSAKLVDLCLSIAEEYSNKWTEHTALMTLEVILSRIASLSTDSSAKIRALRAQIRCLKIASGWINQLESLLKQSHEFITDKQIEKFREHLTNSCCCAILCFFHDSETLELLISLLQSGVERL